MIKLFITDLDGCISYPFRTPDWEAITAIKKLNEKSKSDSLVPSLTICTGRPLPYAEAVAQWLDVDLPFIFESGGGSYDIGRNFLEWHPSVNGSTQQAVREIKEWLEKVIIKNYTGTIPEFAKHTDAGLINPDSEKIDIIYRDVKAYISNNYPNFEVHHTDVSVNIFSTTTNKGMGISWLCERLNVDPKEVAYIGDTSGDIPGLELVGYPFAPLNATRAVKEIAEVIPFEATRAVLKTYEKLVEHNADAMPE